MKLRAFFTSRFVRAERGLLCTAVSLFLFGLAWWGPFPGAQAADESKPNSQAPPGLQPQSGNGFPQTDQSLLGLPAPPAAATINQRAPSDQSTLNNVLNSTVTSPSTPSLEALPQTLKDLPAPELPPEVNDHNKNKTITLGPFHMGQLIQIATLHPVRMEAKYNQVMTLREVLEYTLRNSLPIRINFQTAEANRYNLFNTMGGFLPNASTIFTYEHGNIFPSVLLDSRIFAESLNFPVFQGGKIMYGMLTQYFKYHAAHEQYAASINDTLLTAYNAYYNLLLQRALLYIDIKAVEVDQTQLRLNEELYMAGTGTQFAIMQSRTQLALDRQALLQQQVNSRLAVLQMGFTMNLPMAINVIPADSTITESSLWNESTGINTLLNLTLTHRPELREFEFLRLSAARSIAVASASLYPTAQWSITYEHTSTTLNTSHAAIGGLASASSLSLSNLAGSGAGTQAVGVTTAGFPIINGTAPPLVQPIPGTGALTVTPGLTNTTFGTATASTTTGGNGNTVVTGGSGTLGSTSVIGSSGSGSGSVSAGASNLPTIGSLGGKFNAVVFSFNINYTLGNLGAGYAANILQARTAARQALLQCNLALQQVNQQVRAAYLKALTAREQIDVAATSVASSTEELRLANLRLQMGVGTNLELIQAQRDYIQALITQAQAIITSNEAQAQLLHDTGIISVPTLTAGYRPEIGSVGSVTH